METVEFTVGVLGSGQVCTFNLCHVRYIPFIPCMLCCMCVCQVFGELAVLDCEVSSPVSAISSTAVELYCFDINTMSHVQW